MNAVPETERREALAHKLRKVISGPYVLSSEDELKPYEWRLNSQHCIGMSLVGMAEQGDLEREHVAELFLTAMANVANNKSGKWLADLLDWVCNDEELLERERNPGGRVTVSPGRLTSIWNHTSRRNCRRNARCTNSTNSGGTSAKRGAIVST
jgi:hypothetical protein